MLVHLSSVKKIRDYSDDFFPPMDPTASDWSVSFPPQG